MIGMHSRMVADFHYLSEVQQDFDIGACEVVDAGEIIEFNDHSKYAAVQAVCGR